MIQAWPQDDGSYALRNSPNHSRYDTTYHKKDRIKELGGKWNGKEWRISKEALKEVPAEEMFYCKIASHCHMEEEMTWVTHSEYLRGSVLRGCSMCDTPQSCGSLVEILK